MWTFFLTWESFAVGRLVPCAHAIYYIRCFPAGGFSTWSPGPLKSPAKSCRFESASNWSCFN